MKRVVRVSIFFMLLIWLAPSRVLSQQEITISTIGSSVSDSGSVRLDDSSCVLKGMGKGIRDTADDCLFAFARLYTDFEIKTSVTAPGSEAQSEAGLMIRAGLNSNSPYVSLVNSSFGCFILSRSSEGGAVSVTKVSSEFQHDLKIKRIGSVYSFYYKDSVSQQFDRYHTDYTVVLSPSVVAGCVLAPNNFSETAEHVFSNISGLPIVFGYCEEKMIDFSVSDIDSAGLDTVANWYLDSGFVKSVTPGGNSYAFLSTDDFVASRSDSPLSFSWKVCFETDTVLDLAEFVLFGSEGLHLRDRAHAAGRPIGSGGILEIGVEASSSDIVSTGDVILNDRSQVDGSISTGGDITIRNQVIITGEVNTRTPVSLPTIPTKTVPVGTANKHVYSGDSVNLSPGNYNEYTVYQNAKIRFRPGIYNFRKLKLEPEACVYIDAGKNGAVEVNMKDEFRIADRTKFILSDTSAWHNVHFYSDQTNQLFVGTDLSFYGYLFAPRADVTLFSRDITLHGGIYGKKIFAEPDSRFTFDVNGYPQEIVHLELVNGEEKSKNYSFDYKRSRYKLSDSTDKFIFYYDSTELFSKSENIVNDSKWLTFTAEFYAIDSSGGNGRVKLLYDAGHGNQLIGDFEHDSIDYFSDLNLSYTTGIGRFNRTIKLDDIFVSCAGDSCGDLIVEKQPRDTAVYEGSAVTFRLKLNETGNTSYIWFKDSNVIGAASEPVLYIPMVTLADSGARYHCSAFNDCDTLVSESASLIVKTCTSPEILSPPCSSNVIAKDTATFVVHAKGLGLMYEWMENDRYIMNSDTSVLKVPDVRLEDNMNEYRVKITNACGKSTFTDSVVLRVSAPQICEIVDNPMDDTVETGEYYFADVVTTCDSNARYTWLKNGYMISDTSVSKLKYGPVTMADSAAVFKCVVSNEFKSDTSGPTLLTVVKKKPGKKVVSISGVLYDGKGDPVGSGSLVRKMFIAKVYTARTGGEPVYTESFDKQRMVAVRNGQFTVQLGRGYTRDNLQSVIASHSTLYAELYAADENGTPECLGARLEFNAAPYSMTSGKKVIYGSGVPSEALLEPVGTMYVDRTAFGQTWIKGPNTWVRLD